MSWNRPRHARLAGFLILSACAHAVLLISQGPANQPATTRLGQQMLDTELATVSGLARPKRMASGTRNRVSDSQTADPANAAMAAGTQAPRNETQGERTSPTNNEVAGLRNQLLGELRTRLSDHLFYPTLARSRGWEGIVVLGLRVESDGRLDRVRIERGSGYAILDESALSSLSRVGRLSSAVGRLNETGIDLLLPVVYRLAQN